VIRAAVAQGWGAATAKACGKPFPDCDRCRRPRSAELRKSWGCDEEARRPVWESSCPRCAGTDSECGRCSGSGEVDYRRCPSAVLREAHPALRVHIDLLLRAYSHYDRRNVLPVQGAWMDQSRSFLAGVDLIDSERSYWEAQLRDHQEREAERSRQQMKMSSSRARRR
jgi:hypothetical protein